MFSKILIANRGEIACRIVRTCRRLGIGAVTVYSDADARSLHIRVADEAIRLEGTSSTETYLNQDKIIAAARSGGCEAIHPGYGFLSENAGFARKVRESGLTFIGPPSSAITLIGDKISARTLALKCGAPVIPGYSEPIRDVEDARAAAETIGYPVLLKPAAGGGGKGMRIVPDPAGMPEALSKCREEARKAFGDDRVFLESCLNRPRHIEVQILADGFGNVIHLGERECSVQRRYQKIIEETPSPGVSTDLRQRLGSTACELARAAGYVNAGTVEFLLDQHGRFYFLEVNARLQVEHPVTEMVTGLDLVELQLSVAAGEKLPLAQDEVKWRGWAMEARICAENPANGFVPSTGMITRYAEPSGGKIRVDSGIETGSAVSVYYDSMMAKIIAWGDSREEARKLLVTALNGYHIEGVTTNIGFANRVLNHPAFVEGALSTDFLSRHFAGDRSDSPPLVENIHRLVIAATLVYHYRKELVRESLKPIVTHIGGTSQPKSTQDYIVKAEDDVLHVRLSGVSESDVWTVGIEDREYLVKTPEIEFYRRRLKLEINGEICRFILQYQEEFLYGSFCGIERTFEIYSPREWELAAHMPRRPEPAAGNLLLCPMPGLVVDVCVAEGDRVFRGQQLLVIESMKMESNVASPCDGVVSEILIQKGRAVCSGELLIRFTA